MLKNAFPPKKEKKSAKKEDKSDVQIEAEGDGDKKEAAKDAKKDGDKKEGDKKDANATKEPKPKTAEDLQKEIESHAQKIVDIREEGVAIAKKLREKQESEELRITGWHVNETLNREAAKAPNAKDVPEMESDEVRDLKRKAATERDQRDVIRAKIMEIKKTKDEEWVAKLPDKIINGEAPKLKDYTATETEADLRFDAENDI